MDLSYSTFIHERICRNGLHVLAGNGWTDISCEQTNQTIISISKTKYK